MKDNELDLQEQFTWARSTYYETYNKIIGYYQAQACLEHARGESLLDVPCGDGTITEFLAPRFKSVVGVDASKKHLDAAKKRLPCVSFHHALLEDFETTQRYDTITMINVLEHLADPVYALQKMASLLSPDGVIIVHVPNALAVNRQIATIMGTLLSCEELSPFDINVAGHRRSYRMDSLKDDIINAGLEVADFGGVFYKMLSTPQMDWLLTNGLWKEGGFGWGRTGVENKKDWRAEFCRACYEFGKTRPEDCNVVYVCAQKRLKGD